MKFREIIGWILLLLGILIIFYPLFVSYKVVFRGETLPNIFSLPQERNNQLQEKELSQGLTKMQGIQEKLIKQQISNLIPSDYIKKIFNLVAWSLISMIFIFGGGQVSNLGLKLIKE